MSRGEKIYKYTESLFNSLERRNTGFRWDEISQYLDPNRSGFYQGNESVGTKRTDNLFDNTAIQESDDLAATLHSTLTSPSVKWSKWRFRDSELNDNEEAIEWLEDSNTRFHAAINSSNFNTESNKCYIDFVKRANMCLFMDGIFEGGQFIGFQFKSWHLSQLAWAEDEDSLVSTVARKFKLTTSQAISRWGDKCPEQVREAAKNEKWEQKFNFRWLIRPRLEKEVKLNALGLAAPEERPFESVVLFDGDKSIVEESGFYEMPAFVTRWTTDAEEVYGRGPGDLALPDARSLNEVKKLTLQSLALAVRPAYKATKRGILGSFNFQPGKVTFVKSMDELQEMSTQARFDVANVEREEMRLAIRKAFYNDKLRLPPRTEIGEMTAYEVSERLAEVHKVLGPQIARLDTEYQDPMSIRGFNMMMRGGAFKPLPDVLQEVAADIAIEYVNPLARTQRFEEINAADRWVQKLINLSGVSPEVMDVVEIDNYARGTGQVEGVPESMIRGKDAVQKIREQREEMLEQERQAKINQIEADAQSKKAVSEGLQ